MRLFSKYLLLLASVPILIIITLQAVGQIVLFIGTLLIGQLLPLMGIFSGMVDSSEIFKELIIHIIFSITSLGLSLAAVYFAYKFYKIIWHDLPVKLYILFSFLFLMSILTILSVITGVYVTDYFSQMQQTTQSPEKMQLSYSAFILLFDLLPYGLLTFFYTHQRDKNHPIVKEEIQK